MGRRPDAPFELPREILIRGKRWLVVTDEDLDGSRDMWDARSLHTLRHYVDGITYPSRMKRGPRREIHVASRKHDSPRALASTFLHELLHACSSQVVPMSREEQFVSDVEAPLLRALEQLEWRWPKKRKTAGSTSRSRTASRKCARSRAASR